ncbi:MAG: DUF2461 family protein [Methanosarcinales archaeon]|nr:DUF2461 family protein [Methanosarcinales archaeon]
MPRTLKSKSTNPEFETLLTQSYGSGSIMRIYRDVRFSKDKSPYNTRILLIFWLGSGKESPGFFIGIDPCSQYIGITAASDVISTPEFVNECFEHCQNMMPLTDWQTKVL